jgi:hypothetical protein
VLLAVLEAPIRSQKYGPAKLRRSQQAQKILGLHYTRFLRVCPESLCRIA